MCKGPEEHHRLASGGMASRPVQTREVAVGARSGALGATEGTSCWLGVRREPLDGAGQTPEV